MLGSDRVVTKPVADRLDGASARAARAPAGRGPLRDRAADRALRRVQRAGVERLAVTTGEDFPDALAGGVMQGRLGSVVLLTPRRTSTTACTRARVVRGQRVHACGTSGARRVVRQYARDGVTAALTGRRLSDAERDDLPGRRRRARYEDTFGAPRSGGRTHEGTDIMAARNTPVVACVNGIVSTQDEHARRQRASTSTPTTAGASTTPTSRAGRSASGPRAGGPEDRLRRQQRQRVGRGHAPAHPDVEARRDAREPVSVPAQDDALASAAAAASPFLRVSTSL